jgi:hypothetical protein
MIPTRQVDQLNRWTVPVRHCRHNGPIHCPGPETASNNADGYATGFETVSLERLTPEIGSTELSQIGTHRITHVARPDGTFGLVERCEGRDRQAAHHSIGESGVRILLMKIEGGPHAPGGQANRH